MGMIDVHLAAAPGPPVPTRMLIVLHGKDRAAERYCRQWRGVGYRDNLLIAAPRFDLERFPSWRDYNLAGMLDQKGRPTSSDRWLFPTLYAISGELRHRYDIDQVDFFGHSAGAQFLFRYALFSKSSLHASQMIVANAGWYTRPGFDDPFPYGLTGAPEDVDLRTAFSRRVTLLAGGWDIDGHHHSLRKDSGVRRQGAHRLARARSCFEDARATAFHLQCPLRWRLRIVSNAAHSNADMVPAALDLLVERGSKRGALSVPQPKPARSSSSA
jgi:pimeloyl-ACP methyl ester carboxylesterase